MVKRAEKFTGKAKDCAERWRAYFQKNIDQYHYFFEFVMGNQWTDEESNMLQTYKKIPLQFNKLATLINSLLGEQQQNTPQLQVVPMENCTEEVAAIREAIVKDIMFSGGAKTVYQIAASQAFIGGFGAFAVLTDYASQKSFDLDIIYKHFKDATKCYWDMSAESVSKTDGQYCGWLSRISRSQFRQLYGKDIEKKILNDNAIYASDAEVATATDPKNVGGAYTWADDNSVTIQDHFVRELKSETLYKLSNGKILSQLEMDELVERSIKHYRAQQEAVMTQEFEQGEDVALTEEMEAPEVADEEAMESGVQDEIELDLLTLYDEGEAVRIEEERRIKRGYVKHYKICGDYILDETDFPSEQLPLVFVDQNSYYNKQQQQVCRSFVGDAKDAQKYINYLGTQSAYVLKVSRFDQWIGSKKNVSSNDTASVWRDPLSQQGMLTYDESPNGDRPQQIQPPELSQSLLTQYQRAIEDLYTSTGLYPSRLGMQGNEVSGAAIDARTRQGSYSTYCAFNAVNRAIATGGEIVNEMIPKVYDAERVMTLMMPEEGLRTLRINHQLDEYGEVVENDIRKGTFEVRLLPGPSYEGQKEQALQSLQMALQANPQLFTLIADLYAENLPLTNTINLKNRFKTLVPPEIIQAGKTGTSPRPQGEKANPEAQLAQLEMQAKQQELALKAKDLELKAAKQQAETEREIMRLETERLQVAAQLEEQKLRYLAETQRTHSDNAIAHADNLTKILTHKP